MNRARIVTLNGGYREELSIELFVTRDREQRHPLATVCPSEVRIVNKSKKTQEPMAANSASG